MKIKEGILSRPLESGLYYAYYSLFHFDGELLVECVSLHFREQI